MAEDKICPFLPWFPGNTVITMGPRPCIKEDCQLYIENWVTCKHECAIVKTARMLDILARRGEER